MSLFPIIPPTIVPHVSVAADWQGSVKGAYTFSAGSIQPDGTDSGIQVVDGHKFAGDFEVTQTMTTIGTEFGWGVYLSSEDGTFDATLSHGNLNAMTGSWWWDGSVSQWRYGSANQSAMTLSNGDTTGIKRVGAVITGYKNGVLDHTWSQQSSAEVRLVWGCGSASTPVCNNLQWTGGG